MTEHSIAHGSFTIERRLKASPAKVFAAWADPEIKAKWFGGPSSEHSRRAFEFRVGGWEKAADTFPDGTSFSFDANYRDIVENNRIVYTYDMQMNGKRISVSLATIEMRPDGNGTHLVVSETGAFLDGLDNVEQRRDGTEQLMSKLAEAIED